METKIVRVKEFENPSFEVRYYEAGRWQIDVYVDEEEKGVERMNYLMKEYDFREDDVMLTKLTYYENIIE